MGKGEKKGDREGKSEVDFFKKITIPRLDIRIYVGSIYLLLIAATA